MSKVTAGKYKDEEAVIIENDKIKVILLPGWGSKLASIVYKPLGRELLWQNPGDVYRKTTYGDCYENGEMSGLDEMFPTISRCNYEGYPWTGAEMPDHGEVWSIPWDYEIENDVVKLWVYGVRFPYKLEKTIFIENDCVYLKYKATNLSGFNFDFIWAAHPLFNAFKGMEFIVPSEMNTVVNSVAGPRLKEYGSFYNFPVAELSDGMEFDLNLVPERNDYGYQKYYFSGKVTDGWCILFNPEASLNIGMRFPKEIVPYLGMWVNEGGYEGQYNIAPEPATGGMDRVDFAKMWGMNSVLYAHESIEWYLDIPIKKCKKARAVKENGEFIV
jgi:hypothetical protein